jgi:hypothetical protein
MTDTTPHDRKVRRIAAGYSGMDYDVRAAVPGYDRPKPIRGRIPDVVATKGKSTRIVEVETDQTFHRHKDQRDILRDYANGRSRTRFRVTRVREDEED